MSFLRLGTRCAVVDSTARVLLSKRDDLHIWTLPGGRLDAGEPIDKAAVREVQEETGLDVEITEPVALYYWPDWHRLNILFAARPVGGRLFQITDETSDNRFFSRDELPETFGPDYAGHVLAQTRPLPQIVRLSRIRTLQSQLMLRWRWVSNLLRGRPEPRFTRFTVRAVAAIYSDDHQRVLTLPHERSQTLPRVQCDGKTAPWHQLTQMLRPICPLGVELEWAGLWQDIDSDTLELVFTGSVPAVALQNGGQWCYAQNAPVDTLDSQYLQRIHGDPAHSPVWMVISQPSYDVILIQA